MSDKLLKAALVGDLKAVQEEIEKNGADPNYQGWVYEGAITGRNSALQIAVRKGHKEMISWLLKAKASVWVPHAILENALTKINETEGKNILELLLNSIDFKNPKEIDQLFTFLRYQTPVNYFKWLALFLSKGFNISAKNSLFGNTLLHQAMDTNDDQLIQGLINCKIDVTATNAEGDTVFRVAVASLTYRDLLKYRHFKPQSVVKLLETLFKAINTNTLTSILLTEKPLEILAQSMCDFYEILPAFQILLDAYERCNVDYINSLKPIREFNCLFAMRVLLTRGGWTVENLKHKNIFLNDGQMYNSYMSFSKEGDVAVTHWLKEIEASTIQLFKIAQSDEKEINEIDKSEILTRFTIPRRILEIIVNACNQQGQTPLNLAVMSGKSRLALFLLENGASLKNLNLQQGPYLQALMLVQQLARLKFRSAADIVAGQPTEISAFEKDIASLTSALGKDGRFHYRNPQLRTIYQDSIFEQPADKKAKIESKGTEEDINAAIDAIRQLLPSLKGAERSLICCLCAEMFSNPFSNKKNTINPFANPLIALEFIEEIPKDFPRENNLLKRAARLKAQILYADVVFTKDKDKFVPMQALLPLRCGVATTVQKQSDAEREYWLGQLAETVICGGVYEPLHDNYQRELVEWFVGFKWQDYVEDSDIPFMLNNLRGQQAFEFLTQFKARIETEKRQRHDVEELAVQQQEAFITLETTALEQEIAENVELQAELRQLEARLQQTAQQPAVMNVGSSLSIAAIDPKSAVVNVDEKSDGEITRLTQENRALERTIQQGQTDRAAAQGVLQVDERKELQDRSVIERLTQTVHRQNVQTTKLREKQASLTTEVTALSQVYGKVKAYLEQLSNMQLSMNRLLVSNGSQPETVSFSSAFPGRGVAMNNSGLASEVPALSPAGPATRTSQPQS